MKSNLFRSLFIFTILIVLSLVSHEKSERGLMQDGIYKFIQVIDLIELKYASLERYYPDREVDPLLQYTLYKHPFEYLVNGKVFSVFPWLWSLLVAPAYQVFGYLGLFFWPFFFGLLVIYYFYKILIELDSSEKTISYSLYFLVFSSPLLVYSTMLYEATLCSFILYLTLYLHLYDLKRDLYSYSRYFILGLLTGLHLFLRIEVGFLSGLVITLLCLFHWNQKTIKTYLVFLSSVLFMFFLFFLSNKWIFGIYEPLILLDVITYDLSFRFLRILEYLFIHKYSFLFYFPASYFSLYFIFKMKDEISENKNRFVILLSSWLFIIILPFVAPQQQGADLTPRYFFPIVPFLAYFVFLWFEKRNFKKWAYILVLVYSGFFIFVFQYVSIKISKQNAKVYREISPYVANYNIVNSAEFNNYLYSINHVSFFVGETPETISHLKDKINTLKNGKEKIHLFLLKIQPYSEGNIKMPLLDRKEEDVKKAWEKIYSNYQEVLKYPDKKLIYENKFLLIYELNK